MGLGDGLAQAGSLGRLGLAGDIGGVRRQQGRPGQGPAARPDVEQFQVGLGEGRMQAAKPGRRP
jgi:hypothetical protein